MRRFLALILFGFVWAIVQYWVSATTHWRDSGEFLLTAAYLDISHPPGSPLFAMWANLGSLLPFGHLAWRITSSTALVALIALALLWKLSYELSFRLSATLSPFARSLSAALAPLALLGSISFVKSLLTVEVYGLLTVLFLILALCCVRFEETKDKRWLLSACFIAGLGVGNHVAVAALVAAAFPCIAVGKLKELRNIILPGALLVLFGASIYAYLPFRANANLSLNTGSPNTAQRFMNQITDARDAALRPSSSQGTYFDASTSMQRTLAALRVNFFQAQRELSPELLALGALGLALLLLTATRIALIIIIPVIIQAWLFAGWDSDPWLPIFAAFAIGISLCAIKVAATLHNPKTQGLCCSLFTVILSAILISKVNLGKAFTLKSFSLAAQTAESTLRGLPPHAIYVNETSWFILKYMQDIEGYRQDVQLMYQPSILFPEYFVPARLKTGQDSEGFNSAAVLIKTSQQPPELQRFGSFLGYTAPRAKLFIEPNATINEFISSVARCEDRGLFSIIPPKTRQFKPACLESALSTLLPLKGGSNPALHFLAADSTNYLESRLNGLADLLIKSDYKAEAIAALERICSPIETSLCSIVSLNNLVANKIKAGDALGARQDAEAILKLHKSELPQAFLQNLHLLGITLPS